MASRTKQVIRQTKARSFGGDTKVPDKVVCMFEPHTEVIRKGKASKPTEFGKIVKIQEAANQIVVSYEAFPDRPTTLICCWRRWKRTNNGWGGRPSW